METLYQSLLKYNNSGVTALYYENKKYSFITFLSNVRKMVTYLKNQGIKENDVITIVLPNLPITIYAIYAINAIGAISNIIHPLTPLSKIIESMEETNSNNVIILETLYQENEEVFNNSKHKFFFVNPMFDKSIIHKNIFYLKYKKVKESINLKSLDKFRKCNETIITTFKDPLKDCIYLHSGGTTGTSKIVTLSDVSINNLASKFNDLFPFDIKGKSMLAVLPTFHGFGLAIGIHAPLYNQASSALMMKFNKKQIIKWINQNKINSIIGIPLLYQKLIEDDMFKKAKLSNLTHCFVGGDNVSKSLLDSFNDLMKSVSVDALLLEGYGLTETVTVCNVNTYKENKIGSVGKPLVGIINKIFDDSLNELKPYEIGEVYVSSDTLMNKYLNDEAQTKDTLVNINGITYVKTGDLGYLDEDGFLFLKGRKKRMYKIAGINIYPSEVEKIVTNLDDVYDASLQLFEKEKPYLVLYVIKHNKSIKSNEEINDLIMKSLKDKVLKYALPSKIIFMEKFKKTTLGKIDHNGFKDK